VLGKKSITADIALRLAKVLANSVQFGMELQNEFEVREARLSIRDQRKLEVAVLTD